MAPRALQSAAKARKPTTYSWKNGAAGPVILAMTPILNSLSWAKVCRATPDRNEAPRTPPNSLIASRRVDFGIRSSRSVRPVASTGARLRTVDVDVDQPRYRVLVAAAPTALSRNTVAGFDDLIGRSQASACTLFAIGVMDQTQIKFCAGS